MLTGINHLAFITDDMSMTVRFYRDLLGMERKFHGSPTRLPLGFDHIAFSVGSREELFEFKDKLEVAGFEVTGGVNHGTIWSIYFFDPNNIPLEISWDIMTVTNPPAIEDDAPLAIASEGAPQKPEHWPEVTNPTPKTQMTAHDSNGHAMRQRILNDKLGYENEDYLAIKKTADTAK